MAAREKSKDKAKERLKLILIHDRIELTPKEMQNLKRELKEVLARYIRISEADFNVKVERKKGIMALEADIPMKSGQ